MQICCGFPRTRPVIPIPEHIHKTVDRWSIGLNIVFAYFLQQNKRTTHETGSELSRLLLITQPCELNNCASITVNLYQCTLCQFHIPNDVLFLVKCQELVRINTLKFRKL